MRKLLLILVLITTTISAQDIELNILKGKMEPQSDYTWIIMYKIIGSNQIYVANTKVENGEFSFTFPKNSQKGFYRLYYDMENGGYADVIFNNENISLQFNPLNPFETKSFTESEENKLYENYLLEIMQQQHSLDSIQLTYFNSLDEKTKLKTARAYSVKQKEITKTQNDYEAKAVGKLAYDYIKINNKYYPELIIETPQLYLNSIQEHYFDSIDFNNEAYKNSPILVTKAIEYIFYLNSSEEIEVQESLYKKSFKEVIDRINDNVFIKSEILKTIIMSFANQENIALVDYGINEFYNKLPLSYQDSKFLASINDKMRLAVGKKAPEIIWNVKDKIYKLSELDVAENYLIAFWSTTCSHCLKDIPALHEFSKSLEKTKVIAIALEDMRINYDAEVEKLDNFINILGFGKWENEKAKAYKVHATPSFFVVDKNKKIIAKPYDLKEAKIILKQLNEI